MQIFIRGQSVSIPYDFLVIEREVAYIFSCSRAAVTAQKSSAAKRLRMEESRSVEMLANGQVETGEIASGDQDSDEDDESALATDNQLRLEYNTVRGYLSAIRNLYDKQVARRINPAKRPDGLVFKVMLKTILNSRALDKRKKMADRGAHTMKDGYKLTDVPKVSQVSESAKYRKLINWKISTRRPSGTTANTR